VHHPATFVMILEGGSHSTLAWFNAHSESAALLCDRPHLSSAVMPSYALSFSAAGPRIWNSLPCGLRTLDISYKHFQTLLKTYMFDYRPRRFVTFYIGALEILLLTYLLTYLYQRISFSVLVQRLSAVLLHDSLPAADSTD